MNNGNKVVNLSLATSERWRDKQSGEQREKTEWHRVAFNDRLADVAERYLRKGNNDISRANYKRANGKTRTAKISTRRKLFCSNTVAN